MASAQGWSGTAISRSRTFAGIIIAAPGEKNLKRNRGSEEKGDSHRAARASTELRYGFPGHVSGALPLLLRGGRYPTLGWHSHASTADQPRSTGSKDLPISIVAAPCSGALNSPCGHQPSSTWWLHRSRSASCWYVQSQSGRGRRPTGPPRHARTAPRQRRDPRPRGQQLTFRSAPNSAMRLQPTCKDTAATNLNRK